MTPSPSPTTLRRNPRRRGNMVPLVALAIAGGIGALLLINTVSFGNDTSSKATADGEYEKLVAIKNKVIKTFGTRFTNLGTPTPAEFAQSGLAPASMVVGGNTVVNGRNGAVSIANSGGTAFVIQSVGITADDCMASGSRFSEDPTVSSLTSDVGGGVTYTRAASQLPLSGDNLATLCGTANARTLQIVIAP